MPPANMSQNKILLAFLINKGMKSTIDQPIIKYITRDTLGIERLANDLYKMPKITISHCIERITIACHPPITEKAIGV